MIGRESFAGQPQQAMSEARASTEVRSGGVSVQGGGLRNADVSNDTAAIVGSFNQEMETLNSLFQNVGQGISKWAEEKQFEQFMKGYFDASMGNSEKDLNESGGSFSGNLLYNDAEHAGARAYGVVANINNRVLDVVNNMDKYREMDAVTFRDTVAKSFQEYMPDSEDTIGRNAFMRHSMEVIPQLTTLQVASRKKWMDEETLRQQRSAFATSSDLIDATSTSYMNGDISEDQYQEALVNHQLTIQSLPPNVVLEQFKNAPPKTAHSALMNIDYLDNLRRSGYDPAEIEGARKAQLDSLKEQVKNIKQSDAYKMAAAQVTSSVSKFGIDSQQAIEANNMLKGFVTQSLGVDIDQLNQIEPGLVSGGLTQEQINSGIVTGFNIGEKNIQDQVKTMQTQFQIDFETEMANKRIELANDPVAYQAWLNSQIPRVGSNPYAGNPVLSDIGNDAAKANVDKVIKELNRVGGTVEKQNLRAAESRNDELRIATTVQKYDEAGVLLSRTDPNNDDKTRKAFDLANARKFESNDPKLMFQPFIQAEKTYGEIVEMSNLNASVSGIADRAIKNPESISNVDHERMMSIGLNFLQKTPEEQEIIRRGAAKIGADDSLEFYAQYATNFASTRDTRQSASNAAARLENRQSRVTLDQQKVEDVLEKVGIDISEYSAQAIEDAKEYAQDAARTGGRSAKAALESRLEDLKRGSTIIDGSSRFSQVPGLPRIVHTTESPVPNIVAEASKGQLVPFNPDTLSETLESVARQKLRAAGIEDEMDDEVKQDLDDAIMFDGQNFLFNTSTKITVTLEEIRKEQEKRYNRNKNNTSLNPLGINQSGFGAPVR